MSEFAATRIGQERWCGPEWARHVAGKALVDRAAATTRRASEPAGITETAWWKRAVAELPYVA